MKSYLLTGIIGLASFSCKTYAQTNTPGSQTEIKIINMKPSMIIFLAQWNDYLRGSIWPKTIKNTQMKEFILLVRVPTTYSSEQAKAVNPKWNIVLDKWKADSVFVTSFVFPGESYVLSGADRLVKKVPVVADNLKVVSSIILRAASLEKAVELAKVAPVLEYGGTVEVREIPPRLVVRD